MDKQGGMSRNRLAFEKSPYLLQHADNPVDWYAWSAEAFETAHKENKPIFLSIGYSTCHWCHVMAHESFEDDQVARLMNDVFISVKVDREERPDIDDVYMTVSQMLNGSGGWPLTIIMTPDRKPFFASTYIPRETRFGRIGMLDLVPRIKEVWQNRKDEVLASADQITASLQGMSTQKPGQELNEQLLDMAFQQLSRRFDEHDGGFGTAPKFPTPHNLLFLLRYWRKTGNENALEMVEKTLHKMRQGGIYDHVGFGFHRYSTDREWLVPHFEKMLYDQAMLLMAYTEAFQATGNIEYGKTIREIVAYVLRDLTSPEGGFYSAEDADSEGVEGKFYVWTEEEINTLFDEDDARFVVDKFNIRKDGNYLEEATQQRTGENIVHLKGNLSEESESQWQDLRRKLFKYREERVHPHKDDKILTDWNGLMIAALAKAAQALNKPEYAEAAGKAADFVLNRLRTPEGRLLHRFRSGEAAIPAYLSDHAFLVWGLLELYEATFEVRYLKAALEMNTIMLEHYWDEVAGGFFTGANDGEKLLIRQKEIFDGAIPSGNSVAMLNLLRLGRMTANVDLERKAAQIGSVFSNDVNNAPVAYTQLLCALDFAVGPAFEVIIAGNPQKDDTKTMIEALATNYVPNKIVLLNPADEASPPVHGLVDFIRGQSMVNGMATAYVCLNYHCQMPTTNPDQMMELLKGGSTGNG